MATYLEKTLSNDEQVLGSATTHWFRYARPIIWYLFICYFITNEQTAPFIAFITFIFVICLAVFFLDVRKTEMVVTNKRVISKVGIISIKTNEIRIPKVESVSLDQSLLGRLLGFGNIRFTGTGNQIVLFKTIDNPSKTKLDLEEIIDQSKKD